MKALMMTNQMEQAPDLGEELFARWARYIDRKPRTVEAYTRAVRLFWKYLRGRGITHPTRETVLDYRMELERENKSASTINAYLIAIRQFFMWTSCEGIYPNIMQNVKGEKVSHAFKKDFLTSHQARELLKTCDRDTAGGRRDYAILALMVCTGLRTIEVVRANVGDIRTIEVERSEKDGGGFHDVTVLYLQGKGRDDKQEYVKLAPEIQAAIMDYLSDRYDGKTMKGSDPLFSSVAHRNTGARMTTRSISRICKEHLLSAGMNSDRLTAHSLRHTAGTLMLKNGARLEEVQQVLRHRDINTTMIYVHAMSRAENTGEARAAKAIFH